MEEMEEARGGRMLIGYMLVSTDEQSLDLQRDALDREGITGPPYQL